MMKQGAMDYLIKDSRLLEILPSVVGRAVVRIDDKHRLTAMEGALRRSEANLARAQELLHLGSYGLDLGSPKNDFWSAEVYRILGLNPDGEKLLLHDFIHEVVHPADRLRVQQDFSELTSRGISFRAEFRIVRPDGSVRHVQGTGEPMADDRKAMAKLIGTLLDITDRKLLEREVSEISELEQRRIGQDLHDGLCQHLAGIEFMSQVLHEKLAEKSKPEAGAAADIAKLVRQAISHTRDLARGLSPVVLESDGLMSALQDLATTTSRQFGLKCAFKCELPVLVRDNNTATHLYRIAQEAVNNAIKHGHAKIITISLTKAGERAGLRVHDDGVGLKAGGRRSGGMGLRIMQYRAGIIGASLSAQAEPSGGTSVNCSFPLPAINDPTRTKP
jgi:PAS domain S-box-containing protein